MVPSYSMFIFVTSVRWNCNNLQKRKPFLLLFFRGKTEYLRGEKDGGAEGIRTPDPHNAIVVLYQLSYDPIQKCVQFRERDFFVKRVKRTGAGLIICPLKSSTANILFERIWRRRLIDDQPIITELLDDFAKFGKVDWLLDVAVHAQFIAFNHIALLLG